MIGAVLTYWLALQLSSRGTAFLSGVLFAILSFVVNLQRFADADIFMCTAGVWVLLCVIQFIQSPTGWHAIKFASAWCWRHFANSRSGLSF